MIVRVLKGRGDFQTVADDLCRRERATRQDPQYPLPDGVAPELKPLP